MRRALVVGCLLVIICLFGSLTLGVLGYGWWQLSGRSLVAATPTSVALPAPTALATPSAEPTPVRVPSITPILPTASPVSTETAARTPESDAGADTLTTIQQSTIPIRDLYDLALRFGKIPPDTSRVVRTSPPDRAIGDTETFSVADISSGSHFTVTARLRYETPHAYWWVEEGYEIREEDLRDSAELFETQTYPTNRTFFGVEWTPGIDGEVQVHIFLGTVPGVGGYYSSADEFPRAINPFSNEKEMFYINLGNARPGDSWFDSILAHEFQHMIHWNVDRNEEIWVNEGLSELAVRLNDLGGSRAVRAFLRQPDVQLTHWFEQTSPYYGASFLFMEYLLDRLDEAAMREIVQEPANGAAGIEAVVGDEGLTFEALFGDWVVANYVDDASGGRYAHPARELDQPDRAEIYEMYPVFSRNAEVHQFGTDYIQLNSSEERGTLSVEFVGQPTVMVVPTSAHSGRFAFWSNSGDDSDSRLTRAFDLRSVDEAVLTYWAWYDIETDYDYAYVAVSADGGETWQALEAEETTTSNPNGNAIGPGYTGKSGTTDEDGTPTWVQLRADLTPYAGREILVRFEYVTDDALHGDGFFLDDIGMPAIGYSEDFESGAGGWQSEGWVRIDNKLVQRYLVQAIIFDRAGYHVERMSLDGQNRGRLEIPGFGRSVDTVVLAVSGATPVTTSTAPYTYTVRIE